MTPIKAYKKFKELEFPIFSLSDASGILDISKKYASKILVKLKEEKLVTMVSKGTWCIAESVDPFMIPEYLSDPFPSYISLQSALYHHGIISQIPSVVYAVSLSKPKRYETSIGVFSLHQISPILFSDFEANSSNLMKIATAEKSIFDFFYFSSAKNGIFKSLPEVSFESDFKWDLLYQWSEKIQNKSRQSMVKSKIENLQRLS